MDAPSESFGMSASEGGVQLASTNVDAGAELGGGATSRVSQATSAVSVARTESRVMNRGKGRLRRVRGDDD